MNPRNGPEKPISERYRFLRDIAYAAAWYLRARALAAARYDTHDLRDLLSSVAEGRRAPIPLDRVAFAVRIAERFASAAPVNTCLFRALARYAVLTRTGHAPTFHMGVDPHDLDRGHAWVEVENTPWLERGEQDGLTRTFHAP